VAPSAPTISSIPLRFPISIGESMCEQAARLLFLNVTWARDLNANSGLCMEDQLTVLESSWRELFLLAAAQCVPHLDPTPLLPPGPQSLGLALEVSRFRETLIAFNGLSLDPHEYSCVRAVVLYKAGLDCESVSSSRSSSGSVSPGTGGSRLRDAASVVRLRDSAQTALGARMAATSSFGAVRFSKLILMLPMLRTVSAHAIEEFFFRKTIGVTSIEKIICDVYAKS
jgi:nuclear receptor subfamily 2 group E protein 1